MAPGLRNVALIAHVSTSVGWLGAVASFLALAIVGLASQEAKLVGAAYVAMDVVGWYVIVPLCIGSLLTGLVSSVGTTWGLFRHFWVVAKLVITIPASILLLLHMEPISHMAGVTAQTILSNNELGRLRMQFVFEAGAAVLALLAVTALSVYKPQGRTQ